MGTTTHEPPQLAESSSSKADRVCSRTLLIGGLTALCRIGLWWWARSLSDSHQIGLGEFFCCILPLFPEIFLAQPLFTVHRHLADAALYLLLCASSLLLGWMIAQWMQQREEHREKGPTPTRPAGA